MVHVPFEGGTVLSVQLPEPVHGVPIVIVPVTVKVPPADVVPVANASPRTRVACPQTES